MQYQLPSMSRLNKGFVITFVAFFLLNALLKNSGLSLETFMGLSLGGLLQGKVWTIITYIFLPHGLLECLFDGLIFWFIGSELENMWGERRYVYFLLTTALGAALIFLVISGIFFSGSQLAYYPLSGPAGIASTMCVAYGVLFPERTMYFFFFPLQAKWFVMLLVAMNLYHGFFTPGGLFAWSQLGAMACGVLWMIFVSNPAIKDMLIQNFRTAVKSPSGSQAKKRKRRNKISHLHIVEDPEEGSKDKDDDEGKPPTYH